MPNLDLRPPALNLLTYYKGDYTIRFEFTDGGSAYPLTDVTAASFIIYEKNGTAALTLSSGSGLTVNGAGGYVDLALTNAQVVALYSQEYNFEFLLTLTGGTVWPIADGVFIVSEDGQTTVTLSDISLSVENSTVEISVIAPSGGGGGGGTWGSITGTLSDQTDLQTALDGKVDENAAITGATKTKITYDAKGLVTAGADATTADINDSTDRRYVTDAQQTVIGNTSGTNTGDQTITLTGDVTGSGTGSFAATIAADAVTNTKAANMAAWTVKGRNNAASGDPQDIGVADLTEEGSPAAGDMLFGWESGGTLRKFDIGNLPGGGGGASYTEITYADMATALSGSTLTPGGWYLITDATGTDLGFLTYAVTENQISVAGVGGYLNADFQAVGDYSGVEAITGVAAGTQQGIWQAANEGSYLQGDMVIWDLFHFQLIDSGAVDGTAPTNNTAAYTQLLKTDQGQGYIPAWDVSDYVFSVNNIYFRRDSALRHFVSGQVAVSTFQWGRDFVEAIEIFIGVVDIPNFRGYFASNRVSGYVNNIISTESGEIVNNTIFINSLIEEITLGDYSVMASNILKNGAIITTITAGGNCAISRNELGQGSTLGGGMTMGDDATINGNIILNDVSVSNKTFDAGVLFNGNTIGVTMDETETITDSITGKRAIPGFSDIPGTIDITGLTALDCTAAFAQYRGIYNLTSSNATESIDTITNPPTAFPFTLRPAAGLVLTVTGTAYSGIAAGQIALKAASYVLDGDKGEYIVLEIDPLGTGALIEKYVVNGLI